MYIVVCHIATLISLIFCCSSSIAKNSSVGMGLAGVSDWSTQYPFIDLMKQSRPWNDWKNNSNLDFDLDANGWVRKLEKNQTAGTVFLVNKREKNYYKKAIVFYEGEGLIEYEWSAKFVADESREGRHVIELGQGNHLLSIVKTNPKNPIRNIKIIPEQLIEAYKNGLIFNPGWISRISQFNTLRYMDWLSTNNSDGARWDERTQLLDRTWADGGVPYEIVIELSNLTNTHAWINVPHKADDVYLKELSKLVHETLNSHLTAYIEHSNEVWNWSFSQSKYAERQAEKIWGKKVGDGFMQWHGQQTAKICKEFKNKIYQSSTERINCVLGVQTAWRGLQVPALECPKSNFSPCYKNGFDSIAVTTYFSGGLNGPSVNSNRGDRHEEIIRTMATTGDIGLANAFIQLTSGTFLKNIEHYKEFNGVRDKIYKDTQYWKEQATKYDLKLIAYEGGQHITANAHKLQDDPEILNFHKKINKHKNMQALYVEHFEAWEKAGGDLFVHYLDISAASKWGSWGALESLDQENSPKWNALLILNKKQCWWEKCEINEH